ncbi:hypothetical protein PMAYCL1PPCAC_13063, partial [Pristionchus mayeri]
RLTRTSMPTTNPVEECEEKQRERKMSSSSTSEPRMRTRSFTQDGKTRIERVYVGDKMDNQLKKLNLIKKLMPRDNSSLFRAVCEQISSVQTDHEELRVLVEQILKPITQRYFNRGEDVHTSKYDRDKEIFEILADITSSRIKVYRFAAEEPDVYEAAEIEDDRVIQVCETTERGVYDSVYSNDTHEALAISQSIAYQSLYQEVFGYKREKIDAMIKYIHEDDDEHSHTTVDKISMSIDYHMRVNGGIGENKKPQFPYCVCKAMDPSRYFNIEDSIHQKKAKDSAQAQANSRAVKFGMGAWCQARDGIQIRKAIVVWNPDREHRIVQFDDGKCRTYEVSDLRPLPSTSHHWMAAPMNGAGRGPQPLAFLPGCMPCPFPPPYQYNVHNVQQPPQGMQMPMEGPPSLFPPPPPFPFSPPFMPGPQQQFFPQQNEMMGVQQPMQQLQPPLPRESESSIGVSPAPSSMDNSSVFPATPLSSRKGEERQRHREAKTRALSVELADSPIPARQKKSDLTWYRKTHQMEEDEKRRGGRRATEGDAVGEMNRPLQPKQERFSTCGSVPEDESPTLPSLDVPTQQMQQLQIGAAAAAEAAAKRAKLPSLLPLPQQQHYSSSEWTGSDTVFKDGEGSNSQLNISNNPDVSLFIPSSAPPFAAPENVYFSPVNDTTTLEVPHFSFDEFPMVNKEADFSKNPTGGDLPDTPTTRFFYNLGLSHFRQHNLMYSAIQPPLAQDVPMPPLFCNSPAIPANTPAVFQYNNMPAFAFAHSAAPPNTPMPLSAAAVGPLQHPLYSQYAYPGVEGMPAWPGYPPAGCAGGQPMEQGSVPSPSPLMHSGSGQVFFPNQ